MTEKALDTGSRLFAPLAREVETALSGYSPSQIELLSDMMRKVTAATVQARQQALGGPPE
ncbi:hypothetical protein [Arthrobacter sp. 35/47]|uniref:hypothetical protein n=1 Tax=Arthrobacter sp. 35/47 TaxID=269454 RepID=UPI0004B83A1F|nr:hypothetical protein [Arthrobacter sp. 35/47]